MAKVITRKQLWEYGLHLEWAERWKDGHSDDTDMSAQILEIEEEAERILGGRWRAGLDNEE